MGVSNKQHYSKILVAIFVLGLIAFASYRIYCEYEAMSNLSVSIFDVSIERIGIRSADLSIILEFRNPTNYDLPVFSVEYDVYINGTYIGHGVTPSTTVKAGEVVRQETRVAVEYWKAAAEFVKALFEERLTLTIKGKVHVKMLFGLIPIDKEFKYVYSR